MCTGKYPFGDGSDYLFYENLMNKEIIHDTIENVVEDQSILEGFDLVSMNQLLDKLLDKDPANRASIKEILLLPIIQDVIKKEFPKIRLPEIDCILKDRTIIEQAHQLIKAELRIKELEDSDRNMKD